MKILLLLISSVLFISCDYWTYIEIINKTEGEIEIRYYTMNENDSISEKIIELPDFFGEQKYIFDNGMNNFWTDKEIEKFIENIYEVSIVTEQKTIIYNQKQLYEYLKKCRDREGRHPQKIKIVISDS